MRKLVISVLFALTSAASLKPRMNAFADTRFDASEDRNGLHDDSAYLPGSDGVKRKLTVVAKDIKDGTLNLKQCLNACFDGCKLSDNNCFQSCSSSCISLNAQVESVSPAYPLGGAAPARVPTTSNYLALNAEVAPVTKAGLITVNPSEDNSSSSSKIWILVGVVATVAVLALGGFFVYRHKKSEEARYHKMP